MSRVIASRYELLRQSNETNNLNIECWLATDLQSSSGSTVNLRLFRSDVQDQLIHSIFLERAKQLTHLSHPRLLRLLDYGYDKSSNAYYLVYERIPGKQLSKFVGQTPFPLGWCLQVLLEICDALIYLQTYEIAHGSLYRENIQLTADGDLPLTVGEWGLRNIVILFAVQTESDPDLFGESVKDDIMGLGEIASDLLFGKQKQASADLPTSLQLFMEKCRTEKKLYKSAIEARKDLLIAQTQYLSRTKHYLFLTKNVTTRLHEVNFISKVEAYLAADLLNTELNKDVFGRAMPSEQDSTYYITTARFRLVCKRDRTAPDRNLVVVTIEFPSPTEMDFDRERSVLITASLEAVISTDKLPPPTGKLDEFLRTLDEHRYESEAIKQVQQSRRDQFEGWTKVLALQRQELNKFRLPYKRWELADNGATLLIELRNEVDNVDLSGDEELCMPISGSKKTMRIGFYEEVNGNQLKVGLAKDVSADRIAPSGDVTRDNFQVKSILDRQDQALRRLKNGETVNPSLLTLLLHPENVISDKIDLPQFLDEKLDLSQKDSVSRALAAHDLFFIQGPPGTGKTTAIVEMIRQILRRDSQARILIASQSNVAVDHVLMSLLKQEPDLQTLTVRVGREDRVDTAKDILLDQQMQRWVEQVKQKSLEYITQRQAKLAIDADLIECLRIAGECEEHQGRLKRVTAEAQQTESEIEGLRQQLHVLEGLLARFEMFRRQLTESRNFVSPNDNDFQQILGKFSEIIPWAEHFLKESDEQVQLSERRAQLQDKIKSISDERKNLEDQISAGQSLVCDTLAEKYGASIQGFDAQRAFIVQRVSEQRNTALRLARLQKISQAWSKQVTSVADGFTSTYLSHARVVGATCIGIAAKGEVSDVNFDWVIIDEAGRATHPEIIVPMIRGRKIVLVGDHRQLPPIVDQELRNDILDEIGVKRSDIETSLFQEMIGLVTDSSKSTLTVQYRMHPGIGRLISDCFYESRLEHGTGTTTHCHDLSCCKTPVFWYSTFNLKHRVERREGSSYNNFVEVEVICKLLDQMEIDLAKLDVSKRIGVITGYTAQKKLLRQQLINPHKNHWPHLMLEVNTVDAYQGREMDYIIYSLVRSNTQGLIGFLRDSRRINVALSRARELLVIVGDHETAGTASTGGYENPFFNVLKHIRQHSDQCFLEEVRP
jgi:hypothetical protein